MIYLFIIILLIILSIRYDIQGKTKCRYQWDWGMLIVFILVAGLRWRFAVDTVRYMNSFYYTPKLGRLTADMFINSDTPPLWIVLNSIVKTFGGRFFIVQLIQATIVNTLIMNFFKKYSPYPFACVVLFFLWRYQYFNMMIMKAALALSILISANDCFWEKKYKKGVLLVLIATGFHQSSIVFLITPFLTFLRLNRSGIVFLISTFIVGAFLQNKLGDYFELLEFAGGVSNKLEAYADSEYMMGSVTGLGNLFLRIFPIIFYSILSLWYVKKYCRNLPIHRLEPFIMIGLMFQIMTIDIYIFYRFVYIYYVYFIIIFVHFFIEFSRSSYRLRGILAYVRTFILFFPLLAGIIYIYRPFTDINYNPYSSVIERRIDKTREKYYSGKEGFPIFNKDEY